MEGKWDRGYDNNEGERELRGYINLIDADYISTNNSLMSAWNCI